ALGLILWRLPESVSTVGAVRLAGALGRMNVVDFHLDFNNRYNFWSGITGGFFLAMAYFGTDQSQVGRYLSGRSIAESRMGLLFNGLMKVPMQLAILALGVLLFAFYLFTPPPIHFDPVGRAHLAGGDRGAYQQLEQRHVAAWTERRDAAEELVAARHAADRERTKDAGDRLIAAQDAC